METSKVAVIGSGCAGYTAAIYAARADLAPILYAGVGMGGQLMITSHVENYPGFPEPVLGPELMDRMRRQCERLGVAIIQENVSRADLRSRPFQIETTEGRQGLAETLIVATGAKARLLGLESERRLMGHGVSACATCDGFFFRGKEVCVVGGGDTALEEATFLTKFATKVIVIHRRDALRASKLMQDRARKNPKITFLWNSAVIEALGEDSLTGVRVKNLKDGRIEDLPAQGLFVAVGHDPASGLFKGQLDLDANGYIKTDGRARASIDGVFAAGDVMDPFYRQAITAAGTGCMAALEAERYLAARETAAA